MSLLDSLNAAESEKVLEYWAQLAPKFMGLDIEYFRYVYGTACWIQNKRHESESKTYFLGVSGAQGSGKSTFSKLLAITLHEMFDSNTLVLSLDDFYLPRDKRLGLSETIHPMLKTRGVPGTHDIVLMQSVLDDASAGRVSMIPEFDKSIDDRIGLRETDCSNLDYVIVEGWC